MSPKYVQIININASSEVDTGAHRAAGLRWRVTRPAGNATGVLHSRACAFPESRRVGAGRPAQCTWDGACGRGRGANPASPAPNAARASRQYRRLRNCQPTTRTSSNSTKAAKCHGNGRIELKPQRPPLGHMHPNVSGRAKKCSRSQHMPSGSRGGPRHVRLT